MEIKMKIGEFEMNSLIEDLYNGAISPIEHIVIKKPEHIALNRKISNEKKYFEGILRGGDLKRFEAYATMELERLSQNACENFAVGFRLGARLMIDVLLGDS